MRNCLLLSCLTLLLPAMCSAGTVTGELKVWHKVTITFDGPNTNEQATPNPFTDFRLNVTFTGPSGQIYLVPGYYAADGNAANTSADFGNKWRVNFIPDEAGQWSYTVSFRSGTMINIDLNASAGSSAGYFDNEGDSFTIIPSDKTGNDYRAKGMLRYVGGHHLQFAGDKSYYLKGGADSPENFLGYYEFDQTFDGGGTSTPGLIDGLHQYGPHAVHWQPGDPTWGNGKGKNIIGAINYLGSKGMNTIYFLTYNIDGGDGRDTWPWTSTTERYRFDTSKLDQWEVVFSQMDAKGVQLHVVTTEAENDHGLGGGFTNERKMYYRELVARFSHHLAVIWNIGEENGNTNAERKMYAEYIHSLDPYDHPVTVHTFSGQASTFYDGLFGDPYFEATSIQGSGSSYNAWAIELRQDSASAGRPWAIYGDEQGPAVNSSMNNLDQLRKQALWGNYMGGGAGVEWYFGYQGTFGDVQSEDWTVAEPLWNMTRYAMDFFQTYLPFDEMEPANALTSSTSDYCFAKAGQVYAVYLPNGGTTNISLPSGSYQIRWFDPRNGGSLQNGTITETSGPGDVPVGYAPVNTTLDWVVYITAINTVLADFDFDHDVDIVDLMYLAKDWLRCNDPSDSSCENVLAPAMTSVPQAITAMLAPVFSVVAGTNGNPPYMLQSITVGSYTVTVDQLVTGTSTGVADQDGVITNADNFDLNSIAARNNPSDPVWTITMLGGQQVWINTNGDNPDFFIFEAGMNDNIVVQAILSGGQLGQSISIPSSTWGDTGLDRVGNPNGGQSIGGLAFAVTDLLDSNGIPLTNSHVIEGIRVTSATLDPSCFCAINSNIDNFPPQVNAGADQIDFLRDSTLTFQLNGSVTDDGKPEPASLTYGWTISSKPTGSTVTFDPSDTVLNPEVTVDTTGVYTLTLSASDGLFGRSDEILLTAVEASCDYIRENNFLLQTDISGPEGVSDCRVNLYDLAELASYWMQQ